MKQVVSHVQQPDLCATMRLMFSSRPTNLSIQGDTLILTGRGFETKIDYKKIGTLDIERENVVVSAIEGIPLERLDLAEPELQNQLRVSLVVAGVAFNFTVPKEQGYKLAFRAVDEMEGTIDQSNSASGKSRVKSTKVRNLASLGFPIHFHRLLAQDVHDRLDAGNPVDVAHFSMEKVPYLGIINHGAPITALEKDYASYCMKCRDIARVVERLEIKGQIGYVLSCKHRNAICRKHNRLVLDASDTSREIHPMCEICVSEQEEAIS
jgi:hypothetical protein